MELVDIFDRDGNILETGRPRGTSPKAGEYLRAVGMWIVNSSGQVFITKRSPEKRYAPNKWENPAGHVMSGEDSLAAVLREVKEETGIAVLPQQVTFLGASCAWPYLGRDYGVKMDFDIAAVKLQPGETCDARWAEPSVFVQMMRGGEFAGSVTEHMRDYKENFLKFTGLTEL